MMVSANVYRTEGSKTMCLGGHFKAKEESSVSLQYDVTNKLYEENQGGDREGGEAATSRYRVTIAAPTVL